MAVLYHWRDRNYVSDIQDLDPAGWKGLQQNSPRFAQLTPGERLWAFTRRGDQTYVLAATYRVAEVEMGKFEYGSYRARPAPGTLKLFDITQGEDLAPTLRSLGFAAGELPLGQHFQGHSAVRALSAAANATLADFARRQPKSSAEESRRDWLLVHRAAEKDLATRTEFESPRRGKRYRVERVESTRVWVARLDAQEPAVLTPGLVQRAMARIRTNGGRVPRRTLSNTVAEETAIVRLHPYLEWQGENSDEIVLGESRLPRGDRIRRPRYRDFGPAPKDDPEQLQRFARRVRRGQRPFRECLLALYGGKCAITGWAPDSVLEAAHILPHSEHGNNQPDNGLILRADLHTLFDEDLVRIEPTSLRVEIDASLAETPYWQLNGTRLRERHDGSRPSPEYLRKRWEHARTGVERDVIQQ